MEIQKNGPSESSLFCALAWIDAGYELWDGNVFFESSGLLSDDSLRECVSIERKGNVREAITDEY